MATTDAMMTEFLRLRRLEDDLRELGLAPEAEDAKARRVGLHLKIATKMLADTMRRRNADAQALRRHVQDGGRVTVETFFSDDLGAWTAEAVNAETRAPLASVQGCESPEASWRAMNELLEAARA